MAEVLHGDGGGNQINARADKTQVYGLKGNDTLTSDGKRDVLLIGGSGDDSLIMSGGNGTISGGDGKDTFELNYSATKPLSAVIEDLEPSEDKIVVNFAGSAALTTNSVKSGDDDVVWHDSTGNLNVTLKGVRENDYFDGTGDAANDDRYFEILKLTNDEREKPSTPSASHASIVAQAQANELLWLTLSDGLTKAAEIRAKEISEFFSHTRPGNLGSYSTVFEDPSVGKTYSVFGENIHAGSSLASGAVDSWIGSLSHHKNILSINPNTNDTVGYSKLGVGYYYEDSLDYEHYWVQLFGSNVTSPETVSAAELSTAKITINTITSDSKLVTLADDGATYQNTVEGATIQGGKGNDSIDNSYANVSISGNAGDDTVKLDSTATSNVIAYATGDGSDSVSGFDGNDTLLIGGGSGTYSKATVGSDIVVTVDEGKITLAGAASLSTVNISGIDNTEETPSIPTPLHFTNNVNNTMIECTDLDDTITNNGNNVTIAALGGNDSIENYGANATLHGGTGDDRISLNLAATNNVIQYAAGDGNDLIEGFNETSTLSIGGATFVSSTVDGSDFIVTLGEGKVTLAGAASLAIHINDEVITPQIVQPTIQPVPTPVDEKITTLTESDDNYSNTVEGATILALGGNDSIYNPRDYANVSIDGGTGDDSIRSYGVITTVNGGAGNDSIYNDGGGVIVLGGAGNDSVYNDTHNVINNEYGYVTISTGAGDDSIYNNDPNISINGGAGNDVINMHGWYNNTIGGGGGNDSIYITGSDNDLIEYTPGDGNDSIHGFNETSTLQIADGNGTYSTQKSGDDVIVTVGDGSVLLEGAASLSVIHINDYNRSPASKFITLSSYPDNYTNAAAGVTIAALGSDDTLVNAFANVSISADTGDDRISLSGNGTNSTIKYATGDGNDTVWGGNTDTTLEYFSDTDITRSHSGDDLIVHIGTGSVRFVGGRIRPPRIVKGASGTTGGNSGNDNGNDNSSSGNGRGGIGDGRGISSGISGNAVSGTNAGGRSASNSSGRSISNRSGGGNNYRFIRNEHSTTENASTGNSNALPEAVTQLTHRNTSTTTQETSTTSTRQHVYTGGNQVISDYAAGEKIVFGATYTGAFYDGNGDFFAGSTTGALVVQNAMNKVVDLTDAAGNAFVKAYAATTAGIIDGRGLGGFEVINGSAGADAIYAGDGGSQLWGGADVASDAMMGGGGTDIFIGGRTQGADYFLNASSADIVHLNDTTLSDIVATAEENGTIGIAFNTGNVVAVQSSEALSATVMLADGSAYRFNHTNKSWQSA